MSGNVQVLIKRLKMLVMTGAMHRAVACSIVAEITSDPLALCRSRNNNIAKTSSSVHR